MFVVFSKKLRNVNDAPRGIKPYFTSRGVNFEDPEHMQHTVRK